MNINLDELGKKLHTGLDSGIEQLKAAKIHLEGAAKETEASIQSKLNAAKETIKTKKQEAASAKDKIEELVEGKKAETKEAVAEWKAKHSRKKLEKRAERAEKYAEACTVAAWCSIGDAEVAILEAVAARLDVDNLDE